MKTLAKLILLPVLAAMLLTFVQCKKEEPVKQATITTLSVTNITASSAQSGGDISSDGGGDITSRGVVWGTEPNPTIEQSNNVTVDGSGLGLFQVSLTNLQPNITYYLRAYATNEAGMVYGNEQQFTTEGTPPEITTSAVTNISSNSAEIEGNVTYDGGATVTDRGVVWSTYPNPTIDNNEGYTTDGNGLGDFTSTLTGLTPETLYYARVYASNIAGTGYGEQITFTTETESNVQPGLGVTDINGNFYPSVIIGNQEWMASNLRVTSDANDIAITRYCYNNDETNCDLYGGLYTWHTIMNGAGSSNTSPSNVQGICPTGWHLPSDADWDELVSYVVDQGYPNEFDNPNGAGNILKSCRQESSPLGGDCATSEHPRWDSNTIHYGIDEFGFSALPGGYRDDGGPYVNLGGYGEWWSATEYSPTNSWARGLSYNYGNIYTISLSKDGGFSVRCIKD